MSRRYAVVDIETNGGSLRSARITEIAIVIVEGRKIIDTYSTLVNPDCEIPPFITQLTGITQDMVDGAPSFYSVADEIIDRLKDAHFIAHNVNFDYSIIQNEFRNIGYKFSMEKMCSVKLAKKHLPGFKSYSLGKLCANLDIEIKARHRALGDAEATALLLIRMLEENNDNLVLSQELLQNLPQNIDASWLVDLPDRPGIITLYNEENVIIHAEAYISMQKKFLKLIQKESFAEILSNTENLEFETYANWLPAKVEVNKILHRLKPSFNLHPNEQKYWTLSHYVDLFEDYYVLERSSNSETYIPKFESKNTAVSYIIDQARKKNFSLNQIKGLPKEAYLLNGWNNNNKDVPDLFEYYDDNECCYLIPSDENDINHYFYIKGHKYIGYGVIDRQTKMSGDILCENLTKDEFPDIHAGLLVQELNKRNSFKKVLLK